MRILHQLHPCFLSSTIILMLFASTISNFLPPHLSTLSSMTPSNITKPSRRMQLTAANLQALDKINDKAVPVPPTKCPSTATSSTRTGLYDDVSYQYPKSNKTRSKNAGKASSASRLPDKVVYGSIKHPREAASSVSLFLSCTENFCNDLRYSATASLVHMKRVVV